MAEMLGKDGKSIYSRNGLSDCRNSNGCRMELHTGAVIVVQSLHMQLNTSKCRTGVEDVWSCGGILYSPALCRRKVLIFSSSFELYGSDSNCLAQFTKSTGPSF